MLKNCVQDWCFPYNKWSKCRTTRVHWISMSSEHGTWFDLTLLDLPDLNVYDYIFSHHQFQLHQLTNHTSNLSSTTMAKLLVIFALCILPALCTATAGDTNPFRLIGRVYCDTCRAGFETSVTKYLAGTVSSSIFPPTFVYINKHTQ